MEIKIDTSELAKAHLDIEGDLPDKVEQVETALSKGFYKARALIQEQVKRTFKSTNPYMLNGIVTGYRKGKGYGFVKIRGDKDPKSKGKGARRMYAPHVPLQYTRQQGWYYRPVADFKWGGQARAIHRFVYRELNRLIKQGSNRVARSKTGRLKTTRRMVMLADWGDWYDGTRDDSWLLLGRSRSGSVILGWMSRTQRYRRRFKPTKVFNDAVRLKVQKEMERLLAETGY